jgi:hypothetical protein
MTVRRPFSVTTYQGRPAIYDQVARVYYFGFKSMAAARERCRALNEGK